MSSIHYVLGSESRDRLALMALAAESREGGIAIEEPAPPPVIQPPSFEPTDRNRIASMIGVVAACGISMAQYAFGGGLSCTPTHQFPPEKPRKPKDSVPREKRVTNRRRPDRRG